MQKTLKSSENSPRVSTAKAALLFGSGTLTSRILGFIRDSMVLSIMPLDMKDAWLAAFRLPNTFRRLFGEGGLSVSFIPVYVGILEQKDEKARAALANGIFTLLMSLISLICLVCFIFMDPLISHWLAGPGFSSIPGKLDMTIQMARIMVLFLFFICLFAYFMALLNGHKKFTLTGFAPLFLNLAIIVGLSLYKNTEYLVEASAWAVVIGGALQAFFLLPAVVKIHGVPKISFQWSHWAIRVVLKKFLPTLLGVGVLQILGMINVYFASQLMPGAVSYIYTADRLLELPLSLIAVSIGTTVLPTLSGYWSRNEKDHFMTSLSRQISLFYFLALPCAFGLWFLGEDIIEVLFARGKFKLDEVVIVGEILKIYCITLIAAGSLKIFTQSLYATGDTKTPAFIAVFGLIVHIVAAPYFMGLWKLNGLIFSTAMITVLNLVLSVVIINFKVGAIKWKKVLGHFSMCFVSSTIMGVYLFYVSQWQWKQGRFILDFPLLLLIISIAGVIYFVCGTLMKIEELNIVLSRLKARRKK